MEEDKNENAYLRAAKVANYWMKTHMVYRVMEGAKYTIKVAEKPTSCVVSVVDKVQKRWVARVDLAHKNFPHKHININPKYAHIAKDPHIKIPSVAVQASSGLAKFAKYTNKVNEVLGPVCVAIDAIQIGNAVYKDYQEGSQQNTVNVVTQIGSGWLGSWTGVTIGSIVGSMILPGIGTIIGTYSGAILGCHYGLKAAPALSDTILNNQSTINEE